MADHWHYASDIHGAAEQYHRHYDHENEISELRSLVAGLREDLGHAEERIRDLEERLASTVDDAIREHAENAPHIYADGSTS